MLATFRDPLFGEILFLLLFINFGIFSYRQVFHPCGRWRFMNYLVADQIISFVCFDAKISVTFFSYISIDLSHLTWHCLQNQSTSISKRLRSFLLSNRQAERWLSLLFWSNMLDPGQHCWALSPSMPKGVLTADTDPWSSKNIVLSRENDQTGTASYKESCLPFRIFRGTFAVYLKMVKNLFQAQKNLFCALFLLRTLYRKL